MNPHVRFTMIPYDNLDDDYLFIILSSYDEYDNSRTVGFSLISNDKGKALIHAHLVCRS